MRTAAVAWAALFCLSGCDIDAMRAKARRETAKVAREELKQFPIEAFRVEGNLLFVTLQNNSKTAISHAEFSGRYQTPGRAVPWDESLELRTSIAGGLEPGEERELDVLMGSSFGRSVPDDAVLSIELVAVSGPDGKVVEVPFSMR